MKFLTGISLSTWLTIGAGVALAALAWSWHSRGQEIETLTAKNDALRSEIARQNAEIERQRASVEQAKRDLAAAVEASAGSAGLIEELRASAGAVPAGTRCEPSATTKRIWK